MKMPFKSITTTLLLITIFSNPSIAQDITAKSENGMASTKNEMIAVNFPVVDKTVVASIKAPGNNRLAGKFAAMFPDAQNQQWVIDSKGYWVSFSNNGREARAGFNHKGQLNYIISDCKRDQLSTGFQAFILKKYPGYQLFNAIEISAFGEQTQQVILENVTHFITLNSTKDGINEMQKVNKSN